MDSSKIIFGKGILRRNRFLTISVSEMKIRVELEKGLDNLTEIPMQLLVEFKTLEGIEIANATLAVVLSEEIITLTINMPDMTITAEMEIPKWNSLLAGESTTFRVKFSEPS